ncbi:unnamed protein product [Protopolystoma xenopodis]|uniref:Uncharacterized protein n=1 Tax=Protopolystoma xenopodis TaxID=117903 RepID=A0A448WM20_9PLAT|nr:unnamed protein product [Protopolystoma xenopodis]
MCLLAGFCECQHCEEGLAEAALVIGLSSSLRLDPRADDPSIAPVPEARDPPRLESRLTELAKKQTGHPVLLGSRRCGRKAAQGGFTCACIFSFFSSSSSSSASNSTSFFSSYSSCNVVVAMLLFVGDQTDSSTRTLSTSIRRHPTALDADFQTTLSLAACTKDARQNMQETVQVPRPMVLSSVPQRKCSSSAEAVESNRVQTFAENGCCQTESHATALRGLVLISLRYLRAFLILPPQPTWAESGLNNGAI